MIAVMRGGITLELPAETPAEVVDALFSIAEALGNSPAHYTLDHLPTAVAEFTHTPDPQHEKQMAKLDEIERLLKGDAS